MLALFVRSMSLRLGSRMWFFVIRVFGETVVPGLASYRPEFCEPG